MILQGKYLLWTITDKYNDIKKKKEKMVNQKWDLLIAETLKSYMRSAGFKLVSWV